MNICSEENVDRFILHSPFKPTGDQPEAIDALVSGVEAGYRGQTLLGVTGSGKTFTMANVIARLNRPTLILAHNKTLAAQLSSEFRSSSRRMRLSISCHTMIIISRRPIFPDATYISKRIQ